MLSVLLALSVVGLDEPYRFKGSVRLSGVVQSLVERSQGAVWIDPREKVSDDSFSLNIEAESAQAAARSLVLQTPLRLTTQYNGTVKLTLSTGAPPKDVVRLYQEPKGYVVHVTEAPVSRVIAELEAAFGKKLVQLGDTWIGPTEVFQRAGVKPTDALKAFKSVPAADKIESDNEKFMTRLTDHLVKHVAPAAPTTVRSVWPLTFVQSNPPALPGDEARVDFAGLGMNAGSIAQALQAAFTPFGTDAKPEVTVRSVGNSLVMEGKPVAVNEVRRLLATQLDIPQSQILLELDAYQVSAPISDPGDADRSVRLIMLGQEIARAYKVQYLESIKKTLATMDQGIRAKINERVGLDVPKLLETAGIEVCTKRKLGQSELLLFLAYADHEVLESELAIQLSKGFCFVHRHLHEALIEPLRGQDDQLASKLEDLSASILVAAAPSHNKNTDCKGTCPAGPRPPLLAFTISDPSGNDTSERAIEDFLLLWVANSSSAQAEELLLKSEVERFDILGFTKDSLSGTAGDGKVTRHEKLLKGDLPTSLARAANVIDGLMQAGMEILRHDTRFLVDEPFKAWMDKHLVTKKDSRFGVRYGGTTTLAVTSRVPGVTGVTADSFFPFQPVAPIDLTNLVPILMRPTPKEKAQDEKEVADPTTATTADIFAANRLTTQEKFILEALFNQANKPPFYRSIGTGLHFSVVPTTLANGSAARLQVRLALSVQPDDSNKSGAGDPNKPGPIDLIKSTMTETELIVNAFDTTLVSSLKVDVSAPAKREWEIPILSQILPIRSWFVGPTKDKTVRHEAIVLLRVTIVPKAMDLASRYLGSGR